MNKEAFRRQIDREMADVRLSPERMRRIHSLTDRKGHQAGRSVFPHRLPAALLSVAVAVCALLMLFNRHALLPRISEDRRVFIALDQGEGGGTPEPTPAPTEAAVPADIVGFAAASGVRFTLEAAYTTDSLSLFWRVESDRSDQVAFAFRNFSLEGANETGGLPDELNGVDSLTVLGGTVSGEAMPAIYYGVSQIPIADAGPEITVSLTMPVYRLAEEPRFAHDDDASLDDASLNDALDALNEKRLLLYAGGSVTAAFVRTLENNFDPGGDFWSTRTYAQGTLELAEKCGLVEQLDEISAAFVIDTTQGMPHAAADGQVYSDPAGRYDIRLSAFDMTSLSLYMEYIVTSNDAATSTGRPGELTRTFEVMLDPLDEQTIDERFPEGRTVSHLLLDTSYVDGIVYGCDYELSSLRLTSLPEAIYLVPRSHTFYDKEGTLLRDEAIRVDLTTE